jgi:hypothetical protein
MEISAEIGRVKAWLDEADIDVGTAHDIAGLLEYAESREKAISAYRRLRDAIFDATDSYHSEWDELRHYLEGGS